MSILSKVTHTAQVAGPRSGIRMVAVGQEKVGKTTLCCNAPRALLTPLEIGYAGVSVQMTPMLETYQQVMDLAAELLYYAQQGQLPYQSWVIDSTTALEKLIHQATLETDPAYGKGNKKALTMEAALGGYGKAYTYANELFNNFLLACDKLAMCGINIVLTCHVFSSEVQDPTAGVYNTWDLLLHSPKNNKTYGKREMLTQWADIVGFLHDPITVLKDKAMSTAISKNQGRILGVTRQPGYVAGNRFNMTGEISIPAVNGWNALASEIYNATQGRVDVWNRDVT